MPDNKLQNTNLKIGVVGIPGGWSSEKLADAVAAQTGSRILIDMAKVDVCLSTGKVRFNGLDLSSLDGIMVKKINSIYSPADLDRLEILRFLQAQGVSIFSKPDNIIRLIDRLACTVTLRNAGIPMPQNSYYRRCIASEGSRAETRFCRVKTAIFHQGAWHDNTRFE